MVGGDFALARLVQIELCDKDIWIRDLVPGRSFRTTQILCFATGPQTVPPGVHRREALGFWCVAIALAFCEPSSR